MDIENVSLEELNKLVGTVREIGGFKIEVLDSLNIVFSTASGWKVEIPAMTECWATWILSVANWTDENKRVADLMLKGVIFPTVMRITDIDSEYINDIMSAHQHLSERKIDDENLEPQSEEEQANEFNIATGNM